MRWPWQKRPNAGPPRPLYGTVRIVPVGTDGFAVERFEVRDEDTKLRDSRASWNRRFEGTEVECEVMARNILQEAANEIGRFERENEARRAHRAAHPPRVITLR